MALVGTMAYPVRDMFANYPQHYALQQGRTPDPSLQSAQHPSAYPYGSYNPGAQPQQYLHAQHRPVEITQSPVSEDGIRPSLPSISNLLSIAKKKRTRDEDEGEATYMHAESLGI